MKRFFKKVDWELIFFRTIILITAAWAIFLAVLFLDALSCLFYHKNLW